MKKAILWLLKAGLGGLIAFALLTGFCMLYYNVPVHHDTNHGATDYAWESHKFYSRGTEGFAWGKTNNEGYLNTFDYEADQPVDILVMGSSHMEGFCVGADKSTAAVLGKLLPNDTVYNIGTSSHEFLTCAVNMAAAVDKYQPAKYVVLETSDLQYTDKQLLAAINGNIPDQVSYDAGIIGILQKNPFLRLLYAQTKQFDTNAAKAEVRKPLQAMGDKTLYTQLLTKLNDTVSQSGAQLIIVHHPHLLLNENGDVSLSDDTAASAFFAEACRESGVEFLEMGDIFAENYRKNHTLPHGFSNSSVGSGHLNENGLSMIAQAVYEIVMGEE